MQLLKNSYLLRLLRRSSSEILDIFGSVLYYSFLLLLLAENFSKLSTSEISTVVLQNCKLILLAITRILSKNVSLLYIVSTAPLLEGIGVVVGVKKEDIQQFCGKGGVDDIIERAKWETGDHIWRGFGVFRESSYTFSLKNVIWLTIYVQTERCITCYFSFMFWAYFGCSGLLPSNKLCLSSFNACQCILVIAQWWMQYDKYFPSILYYATNLKYILWNICYITCDCRAMTSLSLTQKLISLVQ